MTELRVTMNTTVPTEVNAIVTSVCAFWGDLGETGRVLANGIVLTVWVRVFTIAECMKDVYVLFIVLLWLYAQGLWFVLAALFEQTQPHPECSGFGGIGMPVHAVFMFYIYSTVAMAHDILWAGLARISWWRYVTLIGFCIFIPLMMEASGNHTVPQVLISALLGAIMGLLFSVVLFAWWERYLKLMEDHPLMHILGFRDARDIRPSWTL